MSKNLLSLCMDIDVTSNQVIYTIYIVDTVSFSYRLFFLSTISKTYFHLRLTLEVESLFRRMIKHNMYFILIVVIGLCTRVKKNI